MKDIRQVAVSVFIVLLYLFLTGVVSPAGQISPELQASIESAHPQKEIPVIITFEDRVDIDLFKRQNIADKHLLRPALVKALKSKAQSTQGSLRSFLKTKGIKAINDLWIVNGLSITVPADLIPVLATMPGVESVRQDGVMQAPVTTAGLVATPEWNLTAIHAPDLWSLNITGTGVVVASMDTGVDVNHPDLQSKWRGGTNSWYDPNGQHPTPYDANGHGTQTMGIMVGGSKGGTAIGVAPNAQWIAVKIYNDDDSTSYSVIHQAFQWLLNPDGDSGTNDAPDVVNISWGLDEVSTCNTEFLTDIQTLKAASIAVTAAAGNNGPGGSTSISPANYAESFSVGATNSSNVIATSSSRGPSACDGSIFPKVVAPGVNVKTTDLTFGGAIPDSYAYVSGTSFSAPHAAGAMALLLSADPSVQISDLESAVQQSSVDLGAAGADNTFGYGLLNVLAAYYDLAPIPPRTNTITILTAQYTTRTHILYVSATSALGKNANLTLVGYGKMTWNQKLSIWTKSVRKVRTNPITITVSGIEGAVSALIKMK